MRQTPPGAAITEPVWEVQVMPPKGTSVVLACLSCGTSFAVKSFRAKTAKYCGRACSAEARGRATRGTTHQLTNGTYVEIWGVEHSARYEANRRHKTALYREHGAALIELVPDDFGPDGRWRRILGAALSTPAHPAPPPRSGRAVQMSLLPPDR